MHSHARAWERGIKKGKPMKYRKPKRTFEEEGLVSPEKSYYVRLENVINTKNQDIKTMVDNGRYFSIFAPRQSGKTSFFQDFCRELEKDPTYIALLHSFESNNDFDSLLFYKRIQKKLYAQLIDRLVYVQCPQQSTVKAFLDSHELTNNYSFIELFEELNHLIKFKKIVILIDEFDGIPKHELKNFLTALRELYLGYKLKPDKALSSVGLVGIRNITKLIVGGISPFNIADQVTLPPFSPENVRDLYAQYTEETNQPFTEAGIRRIYELTGGQPWLANRLGSILTLKIRPETTSPITAEDVEGAIDCLLEEENAHFDNLLQKILLHKQTFAGLASGEVIHKPNDEEQSRLKEYGLVKVKDKKIVIANPIYKRRFVDDFSLNIEPFSPKLPGKKKIFISYSREDKAWLDKLLAHLKILEFENAQIWYDKKIRAGDEWDAEIQDAIETSHVFICLISKNFLSSEFIRMREIPEILKRRAVGMKVVPVILETCAWKRVGWLSEIQVQPADGVPLDEKGPQEQDHIMVNIVDEIG